MALLKCKMCGGSLDVTAGETIIECEYCGTQQTLPKTTDENIQTLFNRANLLRQKNEFDKAEAVYEKILEAEDTEAEAYWGVILCKFGIEYVEDPKTYKRIPTCHRTSYDSIVADEYYKKALEHADITQRTIYEAEAKKIDEIQKGILAISAQEEPYDVFICYKETDESGKRTQDSVIANDIYYQLTQEGFKVFYAAITLEDKLGSAYEPIIFAALNSSKVMLSIGTKPEYFSAVWVKNEWSRFLKMMKNNRSKMLIPCYKGMDAYELPEEFAHLQAQDMSKIGFINDIVRGIKKVIVKDEPKATVVKETVITSGSSNATPLLQRAFMFLEDKDWESAEEYCEKVLDMDPQNAGAYLGKLMAELNVTTQEKLKDQKNPFDDSNNYQKAVRFADDALRSKLVGYIEHINTRNENARLQEAYEEAAFWLDENNSRLDYLNYLRGAELFDKIVGYKDSEAMAKKCREKAEECRKNEIYGNATAEVGKTTVASFLKAIELFKSISGWRDADEQIAKCEAKLPEVREKEEKERIERERKAEQERLERERKAEQERLERERKAEQARIEAQKRAKRNKKIAIITAPIVCALVVFIIIFSTVIMPSIQYNDALELMSRGEYQEAERIFSALGNYEDSFDKKMECLQYIGDHKTVIDYYGYTNYVIPDGATSIGDNAFKDCGSLTSITIPASVTSIGDNAFKDCGSLMSITIPASVTSIGDNAFEGCDSLTSIKFAEDSKLMSIGSHVFYFCRNLTSITIPDSVTNIGSYAFSNCHSLTSITIPDSVTNIGSYAFSNCRSLTSITIPDSVTTIAHDVFFHCDSLTSITIPDSVISIGMSAFAYCNVNTVYYGGTAADWAKIDISPNCNEDLTGAPRYYYSETPPTTTGSYWHYVEGVPTKW